VLSGHPCSAHPDVEDNTCDHVEETVFPAETLGKHYVVTAPTGPYGAPVGQVVRLFGNVDGTTLTYPGGAPPTAPSSINAGPNMDLGTVTADFEIQGDHEIGIATLMLSGEVVDPGKASVQKGDPSLSQSTAVEQYRTKYIFLAPNDYDMNYVDIVQ